MSVDYKELMKKYLSDPAKFLFFKDYAAIEKLEEDTNIDHYNGVGKSRQIFKKVVGSLFLDDPNLKPKIGDIPGATGDAAAPLPKIKGFEATDMRNLFKTVFDGKGESNFDFARSISWAYFLLWSHLKEDIDAGNKKEIKRKLRIMWETDWERTANDGVQLAKVFGAMREADEVTPRGTPNWQDPKTKEKLNPKYIHKNWSVPDRPGVYWRENGLSSAEIQAGFQIKAGSEKDLTEAIKTAKTPQGQVYRNYGSYRICTYFQRHETDNIGTWTPDDYRKAPLWLNKQVGRLTPTGFYWHRATNYPDQIDKDVKDQQDRIGQISKTLGLNIADMDTARAHYSRYYPGIPVQQHTWQGNPTYQSVKAFDEDITSVVGSEHGLRRAPMTTNPWTYYQFGSNAESQKWDQKLPLYTNTDLSSPVTQIDTMRIVRSFFPQNPNAQSIFPLGEEQEKILKKTLSNLYVASSVDPEICQTTLHQSAWYFLRNPDRTPAKKPSQALIKEAKKTEKKLDDKIQDTDYWSPTKYDDGTKGYTKWMSNSLGSDPGKQAQLWDWDQDSADEVGTQKFWQRDNNAGLAGGAKPYERPGSAWGRAIGKDKRYNMFRFLSVFWYEANKLDRKNIRLTEPRLMKMLKGFYNFDKKMSKVLQYKIYGEFEPIDTIFNVENVLHATWYSKSQKVPGLDQTSYVRSGLDSGKRLMPIFEVEWNYFFIQAMRLTSWCLSMFMEGVFSYGDSTTGGAWMPFQVKALGGWKGGELYRKAKRNHGKETPVSNFYKILISTLYRVLWEFSEFEKEIKAIKDANSSVTEGDPRFVTTEERDAVLLDNMQCFLLNTADVFVKLHQTDKNANKFRDKYLFTNIKGPSSNFANLIGFKPESTRAFLNLQPYQLAQLQPKIKIFKERVVYDTDIEYIQSSTGKASKGILHRDMYEVPILFDPKSISSFDVARMTAAGGRHAGGGIQEIRISQQGGQEVGNINEFRDVEIKYFFNSLEDMFTNWPRYEIQRAKNNKVKSIKVSYPFGKNNFGAKTPSFKKKKHKIKGEIPYASAAELFFAIPNQFLSEIPQGFVDLNNPGFGIILEVGWNYAGLFGKNRSKKSILRQLNEQKIAKAYRLAPYDTDLTFREDGAITAKVKYYAYADYLSKMEENRLFPVNGKIVNDFKSNPEYKKNIEIINRINKKWDANPNNSRTAADLEAHKKAKAAIDSLAKAAKEKKRKRYINEQVQEFMGTLVKSEMVHRIHIPAPFLGQANNGRIVKWYPYRDMTVFRRFSKSLADEGKRPDSKLRNRLNAVKEALKVGADTKEKKAERARQQRNLKINYDDYEWPIDFIYFGDLIHVLLNHNLLSTQTVDGASKLNAKTLQRRSKQVLRNIHFILGSINIPVVRGTGFTPTWVSLCDLPIVVDFLGDFIFNNIINKENYTMTVAEFVVEFFKQILSKYFDETCFVTQQGIDRAKPEITWFEVFSDMSPGKKLDTPWYMTSFLPFLGKTASKDTFVDFEGRGRFFDKARFRSLVKKYENDIQKFSIASSKKHVNPVQFCFLGAHAIAEGTYSAKEDAKQNIHHFYVGQERGPVKKIDFKSETIRGMETSILFGGQKLFKHAVDQSSLETKMIIPRVFNTEVTLVGNILFETGQTFFVDPVLGTSLGITGKKRKKGFNIIEQTGLGGYYYITKIDTIIAPGRYETILEGKTDKSASRETVTQKSFNPKDMKKEIEKAVEESKKQFGVDNVKDILTDILPDEMPWD